MKITETQFQSLMHTISDGWNEGNARKSSNCFREDAVYVEPPEKQLHHGRIELHEFFGGDAGPDRPMKMAWHHLAFNEAEQAGFGEYTFEMHGRYHGIVIVKVENGLIKYWREYQYQSGLSWEEFTQHATF
jgi:hypothetical protein